MNEAELKQEVARLKRAVDALAREAGDHSGICPPGQQTTFCANIIECSDCWLAWANAAASTPTPSKSAPDAWREGAGSAPCLLERWKNNCGLDIVYNGIRLGYERHMVRDLHRKLTAQLTEWDAQNASGQPRLAQEKP